MILLNLLDYKAETRPGLGTGRGLFASPVISVLSTL